MTFTTKPPTKPGFYAWRKTHQHEPLAAQVILTAICGLHVEFSNGMEGHPERCGGEWCRLVPAEELQSAWDDARESAGLLRGPSIAWFNSRAKRVMEGTE